MTNKRHCFIFIILLIFLFIDAPAAVAEKQTGTKESLKIPENIMVLIPAGEFLMGGRRNADECPIHKVYLDAFYISKYEVTFEQYLYFCKETGRDLPVDPRYGMQPPEAMLGKKNPVMNVSRHDAAAYCEWLSKRTGKHYRLPTEAEWEKAARGGLEGKLYPWGNESPDEGDKQRVNYGPGLNHFEWKQDGYELTAPVGSYPPNGYGLYDMAGNLWEWCGDSYGSSYYAASPYENPKGPSEGTQGVIRGGCYANSPDYLRCSERYDICPEACSFLVGFRVARDP